MEHSPTFGFSSAHRWIKCNGSVKLLQDIPNVDTSDAMEGNAAHWVGSTMLEAYKDSRVDWLEAGHDCIGTKADNGIIITDEMFDAALTYVNQVVKVATDHKQLHVEVRVSAIMTIDPEAWGTADAIYYDVETNTLYIWDFKFGHASVTAYENYQLIGYAQAACETFKYTTINPRLALTIVQPRCYDGQGPVRTWETCFDNLRGYINQMKHQITKYRMRETTLDTGAHCRDCRARYCCPASMQAAANGIDYSTKTIPQVMSPEALSYEKVLVDLAVDRLKQRKTAIDAQVESRIRKGEFIPGFVMENVMGSKKWNKPVKEVKMVGEMFGIKVLKDEVCITPTQTISAMKAKGLDPSVLSSYYGTTKTGVKVVTNDGTKAKLIFSQEKI